MDLQLPSDARHYMEEYAEGVLKEVVEYFCENPDDLDTGCCEEVVQQHINTTDTAISEIDMWDRVQLVSGWGEDYGYDSIDCKTSELHSIVDTYGAGVMAALVEEEVLSYLEALREFLEEHALVMNEECSFKDPMSWAEATKVEELDEGRQRRVYSNLPDVPQVEVFVYPLTEDTTLYFKRFQEEPVD